MNVIAICDHERIEAEVMTFLRALDQRGLLIQDPAEAPPEALPDGPPEAPPDGGEGMP